MKELMMQSFDHLEDCYLAEADAYIAPPVAFWHQPKVRWIAFAASFCIVSLLAVGAWQSGLFGIKPNLLPPSDGTIGTETISSQEQQNTNNSSQNESTQSTSNSANGAQGEDQTEGTQKNPNQTSPGHNPYGEGTDNGTQIDSFLLTEWKGLSVSMSLQQRLNDPTAKDTPIWVCALCRDQQTIDDFTYQGHTLQQLNNRRQQIRDLNEKLGQLLKEGDELCYGEALYLTGSPKGYKWAKSWYDERIAWYGEEFLSKYLGDRVFYKDRLQEDIAKAKADYRACDAEMEAFWDAFNEQFALSAKTEFEALGIQTLIFENQCRFQITPRKFAAIVDHIPQDRYLFYHATIWSDDETKIQ